MNETVASSRWRCLLSNSRAFGYFCRLSSGIWKFTHSVSISVDLSDYCELILLGKNIISRKRNKNFYFFILFSSITEWDILNSLNAGSSLAQNKQSSQSCPVILYSKDQNSSLWAAAERQTFEHSSQTSLLSERERESIQHWSPITTLCYCYYYYYS